MLIDFIKFDVGQSQNDIQFENGELFANTLLIPEIGMLMIYPHISFQWQTQLI